MQSFAGRGEGEDMGCLYLMRPADLGIGWWHVRRVSMREVVEKPKEGWRGGGTQKGEGENIKITLRAGGPCELIKGVGC